MSEKILTGYPSIDKPWLKYYQEKYIQSEIPHMCATEYFEEANRNNLDSLAIDCEIQGNFTFKQFENEYKKIAASLYAMTSAKGKISLFVLPPMALESMLIYAHNIIGGVLTGLPPQATTKEICMAINELHIDKLFIFEALLTDEREKEIYENTEIKYIIYYGNSTSSYGDERTISYESFLHIGRDVSIPNLEIEPEDLLFIARTGGTTGTPKSVMLNSNSFNITVHQFINSDLPYDRNDNWLRLWALFSATAAISNNHLPLVTGMCTVIRSFPMNITEFDKIIDRERTNHLTLIPQLIDVLEQSELLKKRDLSYIKTVGCGGIGVTAQFEQRVQTFLAEHNITTFLGYGWGCTESASSAVIRSNFETSKIGAVGVPLVQTVVSVFDLENLNEKKYGEEGELCIKSPACMLGYYGDEYLTNKVLKKHKDGSVWLHTGDLGMIDKDGFVYIKGRITRTIFVFPTAKVYPSAIEDIISNVSGVKEVVIGQIPDSEHEGFFVPICFIVAFSNYEVEAVIKNIHVLCEESLPKHARPQKILLYEQFPLLPSGKPDIEALERKVQQ